MVSANTSAQIQPWHAYLRALEITHTLVEPESSLPATPDGYAARARLRLARLKMLLGALGNPHHQTPLIHVAGTSGKGSTSAAIAGGLHRSGYRTGLHTSPYLQSATEKLQIDGTLISGSDFAERIDEILQTAAGVPEFVSQPPSYGEVWMALALYWFSHERVDVAVIETGAGGRFDLSNVITPVMSVITSVGIDHTETLGSTIREIAWHKAGIIKRGVPVVTAVRDQEALDAIVHEATLTGSQVIFPPNLSASLPGGAHSKSVPPFQQSNLALAATTLRAMRDAGFETSEEAIEIGLTTLRLPGRFEMVA
ncbi:MAG: folylpolyglutamate synthase/dihydrofolate synthase family protein, partial [Thermomicrobiales bacterium]